MRSPDVTTAGHPSYLALARGALVMGILPGAATLVDNSRVAARLWPS